MLFAMLNDTLFVRPTGEFSMEYKVRSPFFPNVFYIYNDTLRLDPRTCFAKPAGRYGGYLSQIPASGEKVEGVSLDIDYRFYCIFTIIYTLVQPHCSIIAFRNTLGRTDKMQFIIATLQSYTGDNLTGHVTDAFPDALEIFLPQGDLAITTANRQDITCKTPRHAPDYIRELAARRSRRRSR